MFMYYTEILLLYIFILYCRDKNKDFGCNNCRVKSSIAIAFAGYVIGLSMP